MRKDDNGYIVVETVGAFMLFTLLMVSILSLINITVVQQRVHYALTQTANELSMYSYVLDALGVSETIKSVAETAEGVQTEIDETIKDIETIRTEINNMSAASGTTTPSDFFDNIDIIFDVIGTVTDSGGNVLERAGGWIEDPKETLVRVAHYGLDTGKNFAASALIKSILKKHLSIDGTDADTYLRRLAVKDGINGISLENTQFINKDGDIIIVAEYKIRYVFGALPLPFQELTIKQTAKTKAWFGTGEGLSNEYR